MVRNDLLIGKIKVNGITYLKIAELLGVSLGTVRNKLKSGDFSCDEALSISEMLNLTYDEAREIFFSKNVS